MESSEGGDAVLREIGKAEYGGRKRRAARVDMVRGARISAVPVVGAPNLDVAAVVGAGTVLCVVDCARGSADLFAGVVSVLVLQHEVWDAAVSRDHRVLHTAFVLLAGEGRGAALAGKGSDTGVCLCGFELRFCLA